MNIRLSLVSSMVAASCLLYMGCGSGQVSETNSQAADSIATEASMGYFKDPFVQQFATGNNGCGFPPVMNSTVSFGSWGSVAATCVNNPSLCGATGGTSSIRPDSDSLKIYGDFCGYTSTIGHQGLSVTFNQKGAENQLSSRLTNYFATYNTAIGIQGGMGMFNFESICKIDTALTNSLGLPNAVLNSGSLCGVISANADYWTLFYYGVYPGAAGNMFLSLPATDCNSSSTAIAICKVKPFDYSILTNNGNAVYFSTGYNKDSSVWMNMTLNYDSLVKQQPGMSKYFSFDGAQPQIIFGQDYTFPSDNNTVASTGIPAGTILPAGTYNMDKNYGVNFKTLAVEWGGWFTINIPKITTYPIR
jgi:hypothetical protein